MKQGVIFAIGIWAVAITIMVIASGCSVCQTEKMYNDCIESGGVCMKASDFSESCR